jgi:hypothetical protein
MPPIPLTAILRRSPRVAYRELGADRGAVLLKLDTGAYHGIDQMGVLIWSLLETSPSFAELLPRLREELQNVPAAFESEIGEFLSDLRDRDLIEVVDPNGG